MAPRPLVNTTIVCNTSLTTCASALNSVQERYEDAERLIYILGALLGIVFLLFICSPLIFNLPKDKGDKHKTTRQARPPPPPPRISCINDGIEMRDFADGREILSPEQFVIGDDESPDASAVEDESPNTTQSTLPDPQQFQEVMVDGERFHINKSQASISLVPVSFAGPEMSTSSPHVVLTKPRVCRRRPRAITKAMRCLRITELGLLCSRMLKSHYSGDRLGPVTVTRVGFEPSCSNMSLTKVFSIPSLPYPEPWTSR